MTAARPPRMSVAIATGFSNASTVHPVVRAGSSATPIETPGRSIVTSTRRTVGSARGARPMGVLEGTDLPIGRRRSGMIWLSHPRAIGPRRTVDGGPMSGQDPLEELYAVMDASDAAFNA